MMPSIGSHKSMLWCDSIIVHTSVRLMNGELPRFYGQGENNPYDYQKQGKFRK